MNNLLSYKGFSGSIEFDAEDELLYGKIQFISDTICYDAPSAKELKQAFMQAVDAYLECCAEIGKQPNKPCSGSFNVRISPALHQQAHMLALKNSKSLNAFVKECIEHYMLSNVSHT